VFGHLFSGLYKAADFSRGPKTEKPNSESSPKPEIRTAMARSDLIATRVSDFRILSALGFASSRLPSWIERS
jgi:hypothetical protein